MKTEALQSETVPKDEIGKLSREALYDLIWTKPASKLAEQFGISDVAIAKRCKRLAVPRPSRGYWAKVEAGKRPPKMPLPPTKEEALEEAARKPLGKKLPLPETMGSLHPLALELVQAVKGAKPDSEKRVRVRERQLPAVTISPASAERTAQAFHVILQWIEPLGIAFRKSLRSYDGGFFQMGHDRLYFEIEEGLIETPEEPNRSKRGYSSWRSNFREKSPAGRLTFTVNPERYGMQAAKRWTEGTNGSLEAMLVEVVTEIRRHFVEAQKKRAQAAIEEEKRRAEWAEQQKRFEAEEAIRREKERKLKHAKVIEKIMRNRRDDLLKAAEWWRIHRLTQEFISACEERWRNEQEGKLERQQDEWLEWARKTAGVLSPFHAGYPDPARDGAFSPLSVATGGPYPEMREFSRPPTMPEIPPPTVVQQTYGAQIPPDPQPYPFWLKYQR